MDAIGVLLNTLEPRVGGVVALHIKVTRDVLLLKAVPSIVVNDVGNVTFTREVQLLNVDVPILVSDDGKFTLAREEYPLNT